MLPVAHASVGILAYAGVQLPRDWTELTALSALAALFGSQLPDLIDKPLAYFNLLPSGRSLGHSLIFLGVTGILLYRRVPEQYHPVAVAVSVSSFSHPLVDASQTILSGGPLTLPGYLLWPVTEAPRYGNPIAPWTRVIRLYSRPEFGTRTIVLIAGAGLLLVARLVAELYGGERHAGGP